MVCSGGVRQHRLQARAFRQRLISAKTSDKVMAAVEKLDTPRTPVRSKMRGIRSQVIALSALICGDINQLNTNLPSHIRGRRGNAGCDVLLLTGPTR